MKSDKPKDGLIQSYQRAGESFLAYKLESVFKQIKTDEDRILHNEIVREIAWMTGEKSEFGKYLARMILYERPKSKVEFLYKVAQLILGFIRKG